jgi:hypothetical protein
MNYTVNQPNIQKYAERLTNDLCRQFFINKAFISGPEILQFNPENQLNLLIVKNIFLSWQKESLKLKSPFFDYENEEVKQAMKSFMNTLSRHIKVYRYDFEPIVKKSIAEIIMLAAAPQEFFTREIEGLASPKVQLSLLKDFCKYIKINKFVVEQVISEIENAGYTEYFGGETIRHMLKAINENPDKMAVPELALSSILEQLQADVTDFVSVPKPLVTRPAFLDEKPEAISGTSSVDESNDQGLIPDDEPSEWIEESEEPVSEVTSEITMENIPQLVAETEPELAAEEDAEITVDAQLEMVAEPETESEMENPAETTEIEKEVETEKTIQDFDTPEAEIPLEEFIPRRGLFSESSPSETGHIAGEAELPVHSGFTRAEPINLNEALKMSEERTTLAQALKTRTVAAPFKTLVPMHYRFAFINSLFAGNQQAWAEAVEKIDQTESFDEAVEMLKTDYAEKYNWDKEEDNLAILFSYIERKF